MSLVVVGEDLERGVDVPEAPDLLVEPFDDPLVVFSRHGCPFASEARKDIPGRSSTVTAYRIVDRNCSVTIADMPLEELSGDPFDALGDPNRRTIVELLRAGDRSVQELADELPISRPAVSRHLRVLKQAGLVVDEAEGTRRLYRLHDQGIDAVRIYLEEVWGDAATRFRLAAENRRDRAPGERP